jgi:hypothetical protein
MQVANEVLPVTLIDGLASSASPLHYGLWALECCSFHLESPYHTYRLPMG